MSRALRTAEIIAIGSELLTPHRLDTNSLWITARLNELGIDVRGKSIVGDDRDDLRARLTDALARADVIVTTGGLGPTDDDLTREVVAAVLGRPLHEDAEIVASLRERFAKRNMTMPEINRRQAMVPEGGTPLANATGSAPGLWIEADQRVVILLPGPPREVHSMFEASVAPRLAARTGGRQIRRRVLKITGRSESHVDEIAQPIYGPWRQAAIPIETTILAVSGQIELHLSASGADLLAVDAVLDAAVESLRHALGSVVYSVDGRPLEGVVGALLAERGMKIAAAESCTAGLLLGRLTDIPGSSGWVIGGIVAYANDVKTRDLAVPADLIATHGAVSEPVAVAMAEGAKARFGADVSVAITGVAGPAGGTEAKPVGTVVIAVTGPATTVRTFTFPGDRQMVRYLSTSAALDLIRRLLLGL